MDFSYFDIVIVVLVLFLGLKGIINGFFKELFGLIGVVGGIFIASRVGDSVGQLISDTIFKLQNSAAIGFTGFLVTLAVFWLFMVGIGNIFKKLTSVSGLGIFDRILGFIFSAGKFFLIAAVIIYAASNIKAMKTNIDSMMQKSVLFPLLVKVGGNIMKLDPISISGDINKTIEKSNEMIQEGVSKTIQNSAIDIVEETKSKIEDIKEQNLQKEEGK